MKTQVLHTGAWKSPDPSRNRNVLKIALVNPSGVRMSWVKGSSTNSNGTAVRPAFRGWLQFSFHTVMAEQTNKSIMSKIHIHHILFPLKNTIESFFRGMYCWWNLFYVNRYYPAEQLNPMPPFLHMSRILHPQTFRNGLCLHSMVSLGNWRSELPRCQLPGHQLHGSIWVGRCWEQNSIKYAIKTQRVSSIPKGPRFHGIVYTWYYHP